MIARFAASRGSVSAPRSPGTAVVVLLLPVLLLLLTAGCATVPAGNPQSGYSIHGFVGESKDVAAPGATVLLLDGATGAALASTEANILGRYMFTGLQPGHYVVKVNDKSREVVLAAENKRLDINLSAEDGRMNYAEGATEELTRAAMGAGGGAAGPPPGPNDPELANQIAGVWWGYQGSTETKISLCPDGRFEDFSESSYSGRGNDSQGNQTMAWGSVGSGAGQGSWSIQGNTESGTISVRYNNGNTRVIPYRQTGEQGCLLFDGVTLCRNGGC